MTRAMKMLLLVLLAASVAGCMSKQEKQMFHVRQLILLGQQVEQAEAAAEGEEAAVVEERLNGAAQLGRIADSIRDLAGSELAAARTQLAAFCRDHQDYDGCGSEEYVVVKIGGFVPGQVDVLLPARYDPSSTWGELYVNEAGGFVGLRFGGVLDTETIFARPHDFSPPVCVKLYRGGRDVVSCP